MSGMKRTLSQSIVEEMKRNISLRVWTPGNKLPTEKELMTTYDVSRATIREAIQQLASLGLVHTIQGSGTYVCEYTTDTIVASLAQNLYLTPISKQFILDLYNVRLIEIVIAGIAAEKSTPEDIAQLRKINKRLENCTDEQEHTQTEIAFHSLICKMAGNRLLLEICSTIFDAMATVFPIVHRITGSQSCIPYHAKLIDTIDKHYVEEAKKAMEDHMRATISKIEMIPDDSELFIGENEENKEE